MNFIDVTSISNTYCNPRKSWHELLLSINNIYKNFKKSQIDPKELIELIETAEQTNGVPDIASIEILIEAMKRYIEEYKIDDSNTLFLEFRRHAAIYLFAIGSQEKSLEILKEILSAINTKVKLIMKLDRKYSRQFRYQFSMYQRHCQAQPGNNQFLARKFR